MSFPIPNITEYLQQIRSFLFKFPAIEKVSLAIEEKTKVNVEYFVVGLGSILAIILFSGSRWGASLICHLTAFIYPLYATIMALEKNEHREDTFWLVYWVVYGLFGLLENFLDYVLYWIPVYFPAKLVFILWCYLPQYRGADVIYKKAILPLFKKHEDSISEMLNSVDPNKVLKEAVAAGLGRGAGGGGETKKGK